MSMRSRSIALGVVLAVALLTQARDEPAKDAAKEIKLFDGKTLKGWKEADFYGKGKIHVKDGAVVIEKGKQMTGITYAGKDFPKTDYEVTLEGKRIAGRDFFCTTTFPVGDSFCSFVVGGWGGEVIGLSSIDSADASTNETRSDMEFTKDKWYRFRIRVTGKRIEVWVDKKQVVDLDTTDRRIGIRIECNVCKPFGVATYATTGAVRDIRVRPLTAAEKKAAAEKKD
jgi:Domain of Unknown Function (DUF1080)